MKAKFTLFLAFLGLCAFSSSADQLFTRDGKDIPADATLVVKSNTGLPEQVFLPIRNTDDTNVTLKVTKLDTEGSAQINMCTTSCWPSNETPTFTVPANDVYETFDIQCTALDVNPLTATTTLSLVRGLATVRTLKVEYHYDPKGENSVTVVDAGSVEGLTADSYGVRLSGNTLYVNNVKAGQRVNVYAITGQAVASYVVAADGNAQFTTDLSKGLYIVSVAENGAAKFAGKVIAE